MVVGRRKICICLHTLDLGGAQIQAMMFALNIRKHLNLEPIIFSLCGGGGLEKLLQKNKISYQIWNINFSRFHKKHFFKLIEVIKIALFFRKNRFQAVIPFTSYPNLLCNSSAVLAGIKLHFWNQRGDEPSTKVSKFEKFAMKYTFFFIGNSKYQCDYLSKRWHREVKDFITVPNAYYNRPIISNKDSWYEILNIDKNTLLITMIANFFPAKDHVTAVKACSILSKKFHNVKFLFIGGSYDKNNINQVKAFAFDQGVEHNLLFLERTVDIQGVLALTDIGLLCTHSEGSPNVLLDYMLAGLPIVASSIPCIKELFSSLSNEFLFEPENANDLAAKLILLITDSELRNTIGLKNQEYVLANHSSENQIPYLKKILSPIL